MSSPETPQEVEIKFVVNDVTALETRLRQAGFNQKTRSKREFNTLYDTPDLRLRGRGEILRLRKYGEDWTLTHKSKGGSGKHKTRVEHETSIPDGAALDSILRSLGFEPRFTYEKYRAEWTDGRGDVVLDHTPIGHLAEIEGPPDWIDATAKLLGVPESEYITKSYGDLFLDWKLRTGSNAQNMTFAEVGTKDLL